MTLIVSVREVYGNTLVYPECDDSRTFAKIAGATTLTPEVLRLIKVLGYDIQVKPEELNL